MTLEQLKIELKNIIKKYSEDSVDTEKLHIELDYALLEYINNEEITEIFEQAPRWYA